MTQNFIESSSDAAAFQATYLAATARARHELSRAQRAAVAAVMTSPRRSRSTITPELPQAKLRSFDLILARCQSAATLLSWRKQVTPSQKRDLHAAIRRLQEMAAQLP
jgi:hypothetical protein